MKQLANDMYDDFANVSTKAYRFDKMMQLILFSNFCIGDNELFDLLRKGSSA